MGIHLCPVRVLAIPFARSRSRPLVHDAATGVLFTELLLDRPLAHGETYVAEIWTALFGAALLADRHEQHIRAPIGQRLLRVRFTGGRLPVRCFHICSPGPGPAARRRAAG
jgi:hypothetical protein